MASQSPPSSPKTIPRMIESLSKLHEALTALRESTTATAGDRIEVSQDHLVETTASTEPNQNPKLEKLLVNIEHLKGALKTTEELGEKLSKPIRSIEGSLEEVIKRIKENSRTVNDLNEGFLDAISKDMKTLMFQIPSFKKLSLAGTTAHLVGKGSGTAKQNEFRLPNLFGHEVFDESPAFIEIQKIYNGLERDCQNCFLYFAVFPENLVFKKRFLTYWWIGEDCLDLSTQITPESRTGEILQKFAEKGLLVPVKEDQKMVKKKFRMPPIVRSAAIKLAQNCFLDYDRGNNPISKSSDCVRIFLVKGGGSNPPKVPTAPMAPADAKAPVGTMTPAGTTVATDANAPTGMTTPTNANSPTGTTLPMNAKASKKGATNQKFEETIESIFNVSQPFPDSALEWLAKKGVVDMRTVKVVEWLLKLKNLKVLYLGRWQSAVDEQQIEVESYEFLKGLKKMKNLRLLSLQGISWINKLPNSIKTLSNLRVLDLKSCFNLEKLPQGIGSLEKLTHLDVSGCYMLDQMPKSISKLTRLEVLKGFVTGRSNLNDLKGLKKLRKLNININRQDFPDETDLHVLQELGKHGKLRSLSIAWGAGGRVNEPPSGNSSSDVQNMTPQATEKTGRKLSKKWNLPQELEKLDLQCLPEKELPILDPSKLNSLKKLYIRGGNLTELGNGEWKAEVVRLKYMKELKIDWSELRKMFPNLSYLQKVQCPRVTFCPCDANGVWMKP